MNKENKRPPFVAYVRSRHTGTSPYKPNLGIPSVKPKRPNNQQERIGPISRIPHLTQNAPRRIAQQEPRSQLPVVSRRNLNGRGRVAERNEDIPETGRRENIDPAPLAERNENAPEIGRDEDIDLAPLTTTNENAPEIHIDEAIDLAPLVTNENASEIQRDEDVDLAAPTTTNENALEIQIEAIDLAPPTTTNENALEIQIEAIDLAPPTTTNENAPEIQIEAIDLAPPTTTNENAPENERDEAVDFAQLVTANAVEIERDEIFESAPLAADNESVLTEIPLVLEVIEESPIPRYSLCHETQNTYRMKLQTETSRLSNMADQWVEIKAENDLESDIQDDIDAAVGQTRLLLRSKFEQFKGLIDLYPTSNDIRPGDLGGFWDMIYIQVELLDSHYAKLQKLKDNNWVEEMPQVQAKKKTKRGGKKRNIKVKSKFREAMALRNNAEEPSTPLPPGSPTPSNETIIQEVPRVGTPRVNRIIERARQTRRSSIGIVIRSSLTGKIF